MKVCLDAGHSQAKDTGGDPGAVNGKYWESVAALDIVKKLGKLFSDAGVGVVFTRTGGKPGLQLSERCRIANDNNVDYFISIHLNSADNKSASGIETLRFGKVGSKTIRLASNVQRELIDATGWKDRGVKIRDNLYVLKHTRASAILVEVGFISNDKECEALFDDNIQLIIAKAIFQGVKQTSEVKV